MEGREERGNGKGGNVCSEVCDGSESSLERSAVRSSVENRGDGWVVLCQGRWAVPELSCSYSGYRGSESIVGLIG